MVRARSTYRCSSWRDDEIRVLSLDLEHDVVEVASALDAKWFRALGAALGKLRVEGAERDPSRMPIRGTTITVFGDFAGLVLRVTRLSSAVFAMRAQSLDRTESVLQTARDDAIDHAQSTM